jgi:hypothetical protein
MRSTFICLHCGKQVPPNPRIKKGQKYCGAKECQQARKREWDKKHYNTNKTYRKKRLTSQNTWRKKRAADQYQKEYRDKHPEYVKRNRELQRNRNKKQQILQQEANCKKIVNTDALSSYPSENGIYTLIPIKEGKIVNTDALLVQMKTLTDTEAFFPPNTY